jgi:cell division protease FtsH
MQKTTHLRLGYVLVAALALLLVLDLWSSSRSVDTIPYSEFQQLLRERKVSELVVAPDVIEGVAERGQGRRRFVTIRVAPELAQELETHQVAYSGRVQSTAFSGLVSLIVPLLIFGGLWFFLRRGAGAGPGTALMSIGKSKAKVYVEHDTKVSFKDVAGVDEAKHELQEVVSFLRDPAAHGRLGARMPKGILLVGPPGTGKTLLARAVAGEAEVPFFSISGSEFVEMFVGIGAARVRDLFEQARSKAPCIIFIDELDALGRARGAYPAIGGHDEKEQTLNQLLAELDGFDPTSAIVLLAATNRPEILDAALLRAGRFDRQVLVDRPDRPGRAAILAVHARKVQLDPAVALEQVASLTPGFTGADLANLVNEAALVATRRNASQIGMADFTAAIERLVAGLERKSRVIEPRERAIVAHHEMGHALVASALPGCDTVHKVSIIARGMGALGYTIQRPSEDRNLMTRPELENRIAVLLGGRAAEQLVFGQLSTGAADDLAKATDIAMSMITRYAMVPELGNLTYESASPGFLPGVPPLKSHSEQTAREIDCAARAILDAALQRAREILERNRELLLESAELLLHQETLDEAELRPILARLAPAVRCASAPPSASGAMHAA